MITKDAVIQIGHLCILFAVMYWLYKLVGAIEWYFWHRRIETWIVVSSQGEKLNPSAKLPNLAPVSIFGFFESRRSAEAWIKEHGEDGFHFMPKIVMQNETDRAEAVKKEAA
jgi:hypothetical protein